MKLSLILSASFALLLLGCGDDEGDAPEQYTAAPEFNAIELPDDGKADGLPLICNEFVHQPSQDITVLSVAELMGEAIRRIHRNESVSALFIH